MRRCGEGEAELLYARAISNAKWVFRERVQDQ